MINSAFDINTIAVTVLLVLLLLFLGIAIGFVIFTLFRWRGREKKSIESVLLQVAVPRDNEITIDAMEQLFASLY